MEVVEVGVSAIGLPALFAAVLVASVHSDGVERVGLSVVVANPCSPPQSRERSISCCYSRDISKNGRERSMCGGMGRWGGGVKSEKGRKQGGKKKNAHVQRVKGQRATKIKNALKKNIQQ